jgi:hypothetical protein
LGSGWARNGSVRDQSFERAIHRPRAFIDLDLAGRFEEPLVLLGIGCLVRAWRLAWHGRTISAKEEMMSGDVLEEADKRHIFRAAFDIASNMGLDLESAIDLARHLTRETLARAPTGPVAAAAD